MNIEHAKIANYKPGPELIEDICTILDTGLKLLTGAINYWLSEALIFAHAIACVEIVLLRSDKANTIYHEIVQTWGLPGCQSILEATLPYMPNSAELFIESIKTNGYSNDLYSNLKLWFQSQKFKQMSEHADFQYLVKRINELILVGFNRKIDQDNKNWRVTPESSRYLLNLAIGLRSSAEYENIKPQDLIEFKVKVGDNTHDFNYKTPRNPSTKEERSIRSVLINAFKHDGFVLRHDTKLLKDADQWYKCRVKPGTIEAYLDELAKDDKYLERSNIENAIAPCDQATGYPRQWRK